LGSSDIISERFFVAGCVVDLAASFAKPSKEASLGDGVMSFDVSIAAAESDGLDIVVMSDRLWSKFCDGLSRPFFFTHVQQYKYFPFIHECIHIIVFVC